MGQTVVFASFVLRGYFCHKRQECASKSPTFLSCDTLGEIIVKVINHDHGKKKIYIG